jgi:hypothetical protein
MPAAPTERTPIWAIALLLGCLAYNLTAAAVGWSHRILDPDVSAFRQAQTALTAHFMTGHRYAVVYETPVVGPPWAIPFEFPLYQWVVAWLATVTLLPLDQAGRLVSRAFFLLCLLPGWILLGQLGLARRERIPGLCLLLVSPLYIYWSRAFLIETTALFLGLSFLAAAIGWLDRPRWGLFLAALALGGAAALVKVTTFAGFLLCFVFCLPRGLRRWRQTGGSWPTLAGRLLAGGILLAAPTAAAILWTAVADRHKEQNQVGRYLTSGALRNWNFGTWEQRLSGESWQVLLARSQEEALANGLVLIASLGALAWAGSRHRWLQFLACLAAYVALPVLFFNLYYIHSYYFCANTIYVVAAVAIAVAAVQERGGQAAAQVGLVVLLLWCVAFQGWYYYPRLRQDDTQSAASCRVVQEGTDPEDVILVLGCDWSSEVAYYCRRRALSVPSWPTFDLANLPAYLEPCRGYRLAAVVVHRARDTGLSEEQISVVLSGLSTAGFVAQRCHRDDDYEIYLLHRE